MIGKMAFDLLESMFLWYSEDIIGSEIIAGLLIGVGLFALMSVIGLPKKVSFAFLIPISLGFINLSYLTWFGWLIIGLSGLVFGLIVYNIFER